MWGGVDVGIAGRLHAAVALRADRRARSFPPCAPPPPLPQTAVRTEALGLDRECRRYWWPLSDPGFLLVEEADGQRIGAITSKQQLDEVGGWVGGWVVVCVCGGGGGGGG